MKNRHFMNSTRMSICSPVPEGTGASVLHRKLAAALPQYQVKEYSPRWELFPFALPFFCSGSNAKLIHTVADYGVFFKKKSIPLIATFHGYVLDAETRRYSSTLQKWHHATDLRIWTRLAAKKAERLTAVSRFVAGMLRKDLRVRRKIDVIHNGIETMRFRPGPAKKRLQKEIKVLFSGNPTRRKGFHWLPAIAGRLGPKIKIYVTGGLKGKTFSSPHGNMVSLGRIPYENMPALYRQMDMLLSPTVREGFGLAIAEGMACGLPVVATDCSAIPELVDAGKGGLLCPTGDVAAFADGIRLLAENPATRREMGAYNRARIERDFPAAAMIQKYRDLFEAVLSRA